MVNNTIVVNNPVNNTIVVNNLVNNTLLTVVRIGPLPSPASNAADADNDNHTGQHHQACYNHYNYEPHLFVEGRDGGSDGI